MKRIILLLFVLLKSATLFAQSGADKLVGTWLPDEKAAKIEIFKKGAKYYGKIVWLKEPNDVNGKPKLDVKNPDPKLRSLPVIGVNMLTDFVYAGEHVWTDGKIYDSRSGKLYSCKLTLNGNVLKVRGYIGVSLFGQTSVWTRIAQ